MGRLPKKEKIEHTEESILKILNANFLSQPRYIMNNLYVFHATWESDYLAMTKAGYLYECEVKISRADFKNDWKKKRKHQILEGTYMPKEVDVFERGKWVNRISETVLKPHYFYYAVPEGLIGVDEVPDYAGLIYICDVYPRFKIVKECKKLHNEKYTPDQLNLTDKFYYNMINWRDKYLTESQPTIASLRQTLKEARVDVDGNPYPHTAGEYKKLYENMVKEKMESEKFNDKLTGELMLLRSDYRILLRKYNDLLAAKNADNEPQE